MFLTMCVHQSANIFEWSEIVYIVVGAIIGLGSSISILFFERLLDKKGKLQIFYKRSIQYSLNGRSWGVEKLKGGSLAFILPVRFEFQNTSNTTRVIRDVGLLLYRDNVYVGMMHQLEGMSVTTHTGGEVTGEKEYKFGADNGSYSFVLPPRSIQKQKCEYSITASPTELETKAFNRIILRYYDERNKAHTFHFMDISDCWKAERCDPDREWVLLKYKVRLKKSAKK